MTQSDKESSTFALYKNNFQSKKDKQDKIAFQVKSCRNQYLFTILTKNLNENVKH